MVPVHRGSLDCVGEFEVIGREWLEDLKALGAGLIDRIGGARGVVAIENDDEGNVLLKGERQLLQVR